MKTGIVNCQKRVAAPFSSRIQDYLKRHCLAKAMVETKNELIARARSVLHSMQKQTALLKSFFRETHVAYINANVV